MAKRVFFSFHYDDVISFRANVVRNHYLTKENSQDAGFFDASIWGQAKSLGNSSVMNLIDNAIKNTSVTCVLIGTNTWNREWVRYEIIKSITNGNKLVGIHINSIKDKNQDTKNQGKNIFEYLGFEYVRFENNKYFLEFNSNLNSWINYNKIKSIKAQPSLNEMPGRIYTFKDTPVYDWVSDDGYSNFSKWINS